MHPSEHSNDSPAGGLDTDQVTDLSQYPADQYQVLVRPEDLLTTSPLVRADVSIVPIPPADVHDLGAGQLMPRRSAVDRIADAAGIDFIESACGTRKESPTIWVGRAVARRRQVDGTWRTASAEYEFDLDVRFEEAAQRNSGAKLEREKLQLRKFARQRADTGARLRVIHILAGTKTSYTRAELARPLVLARVQINAEAMVADPVLREALLAQTFGAVGDLYGPAAPRNVTPEPAAIEAAEEPAPEEAPEPDLPDDDPGESARGAKAPTKPSAAEQAELDGFFEGAEPPASTPSEPADDDIEGWRARLRQVFSDGDDLPKEVVDGLIKLIRDPRLTVLRAERFVERIAKWREHHDEASA